MLSTVLQVFCCELYKKCPWFDMQAKGWAGEMGNFSLKGGVGPLMSREILEQWLPGENDLLHGAFLDADGREIV